MANTRSFICLESAHFYTEKKVSNVFEQFSTKISNNNFIITSIVAHFKWKIHPFNEQSPSYTLVYCNKNVMC